MVEGTTRRAHANCDKITDACSRSRDGSRSLRGASVSEIVSTVETILDLRLCLFLQHLRDLRPRHTQEQSWLPRTQARQAGSHVPSHSLPNDPIRSLSRPRTIQAPAGYPAQRLPAFSAQQRSSRQHSQQNRAPGWLRNPDQGLVPYPDHPPRMCDRRHPPRPSGVRRARYLFLT